jgi:hypothetical protein
MHAAKHLLEAQNAEDGGCAQFRSIVSYLSIIIFFVQSLDVTAVHSQAYVSVVTSKWRRSDHVIVVV